MKGSAVQRFVGQVIRERRLALGLTQEQLEAVTELTQSYISMVERGRVKRPDRAVLAQFAEALSMSLDDLLVVADYAPERPARLSDEDVERVADAVARRLSMMEAA